jgi:hypothetical protein
LFVFSSDYIYGPDEPWEPLTILIEKCNQSVGYLNLTYFDEKVDICYQTANSRLSFNNTTLYFDYSDMQNAVMPIQDLVVFICLHLGSLAEHSCHSSDQEE